jgi:DNA-binding response OmpR family regulator
MVSPQRRDDRSGDRRRVARGGRRAGDRRGRYPNVLIADSYVGARHPCARYLERFGFCVQECADGDEAIAAIGASPPHLILVEDELPKVPALRLWRWLKDHERTQAIPVILMTSEFDDRGEQPFQGPTGTVLVKPFALSTMLQEVLRVFRRGAP